MRVPTARRPKRPRRTRSQISREMLASLNAGERKTLMALLNKLRETTKQDSVLAASGKGSVIVQGAALCRDGRWIAS